MLHKISSRIAPTKLIAGLYLGGVLLLLGTGGFWWYKICSSPEKVFWGMLEQSLATRGVTMQATQQEGGVQFKQTTQFELGATNQAHSLTELTQADITVKTETIGTATHDYVRYIEIKTGQKTTEGHPLDVSGIKDRWVKYAHDDTQTAENGAVIGNSKLFAQSVVGAGLPVGSLPVPIGYLQSKDRQQLLEHIRGENIYKPDFKKVTKRVVNGRHQYIYEVEVSPVAYAGMMKRFAKQLGFSDLDGVDQNNFYPAGSTFASRLVVDVRSRQLVAIEHEQGSFRQTFSAYDVPVRVDVPKQTITGDELQRRFLELQTP